MRLVITPEESNRLDAISEEPVEILMERAGLGVALAAVDLGIGYGSRVIVLAGGGNNGGDGYVAARYLQGRGAQVIVHAYGYPRDLNSAAGKAWTRAVRSGVRVVDFGSPEPADLIIDALFGVGFRGQLPEEVLPWLDHDAPVLSVDVPSGLDAATGLVEGEAFTADATVTFHALKLGHLLGSGPDYSGFVDVVDIGLTGGVPALRLCESEDAPRLVRGRSDHKWSVGSVAVVGSSRGMVGAGVMAAQSALNAGAGSVALVCPGAIQGSVAASSPGLLTKGVGDEVRFSVEDVDEVIEYTSRFDVVVLGPGLGSDDGFANEYAIRRGAGKLLIDADGLNNLGGLETLSSRVGPTIVTPHAGEFVRLAGTQPDYREAKKVAETTGAVVLLKGNPTFVLGTEEWVINTGGPELATIGTGDVLAGVVAALWTGMDGEIVARSGAFWHGVAGADLASRRIVTATELMSTVGEFL